MEKNKILNIIRKELFAIGDYNNALTFAEMDIHSNWEIYRERFVKEVNKNDK